MSPAVLITGGGGYLGYHIALDLVKKLHDTSTGSDVISASKVVLYDLVEPLKLWTRAYKKKHGEDSFREEDIVFVQGDIGDYRLLSMTLEKHSVSGIIHTASYGMSGTSNLPAYEDVVERVNLDGTRNVLRAATDASVTAVVFTSTVNVVYHGQPIYNGRESLLPLPALSAHMDHYSRTKQIAEELALSASGRTVGDDKELYTCSLRLTRLYGPHEQRHLPRTIKMVKAGLVVFGYAYNTKQDLVHRDNAVQAHVKALSVLLNPLARGRVEGNAYFISEGNPVNNLRFFLDPLVPAIHGRDATPPQLEIPVAVLFAIAWLFAAMSRFLGKAFTLPEWALTTTEVYKTCVSHTFSYEEAKRDFGYSPEVKWSRAHWDEILQSYGLSRPTDSNGKKG